LSKLKNGGLLKKRVKLDIFLEVGCTNELITEQAMVRFDHVQLRHPGFYTPGSLGLFIATRPGCLKRNVGIDHPPEEAATRRLGLAILAIPSVRGAA